MYTDRYTSGDYAKENPEWHLPESPWKAKQIVHMLSKHHLAPQTICEVGCGAGEILRLLQGQLGEQCRFWGYEISPYAFELCQVRANERLKFKLADIRDDPDAHFDLLLVMDVVEHMEDYFSYLREIHHHGNITIFQFPLDISVRAVLRRHLVEYRHHYGHIHYFTRELAICLLQELGYDVLDSFYTREPTLFPPDDPSISRHELVRKHIGQTLWRARKVPAKLCYRIAPDFAVRVFGDWRLLVLAR